MYGETVENQVYMENLIKLSWTSFQFHSIFSSFQAIVTLKTARDVSIKSGQAWHKWQPIAVASYKYQVKAIRNSIISAKKTSIMNMNAQNRGRRRFRRAAATSRRTSCCAPTGRRAPAPANASSCRRRRCAGAASAPATCSTGSLRRPPGRRRRSSRRAARSTRVRRRLPTVAGRLTRPRRPDPPLCSPPFDDPGPSRSDPQCSPERGQSLSVTACQNYSTAAHNFINREKKKLHRSNQILLGNTSIAW